MRFPKGQLPPALGFWSVTMYDANYFFVNNPLNRYSISARQNLKSNPDGSTELYIQKDFTGKGQGIQLASVTTRRFRLDDATVLAEREESLDHRWIVEDSTGEESYLGQAKARHYPVPRRSCSWVRAPGSRR